MEGEFKGKGEEEGMRGLVGLAEKVESEARSEI